jgi:hypothetical protein
MNRTERPRMKWHVPLCLALTLPMLALAGCKGGTDGAGGGEPTAGAAGGDTNSAATNAPATNAPSQ